MATQRKIRVDLSQSGHIDKAALMLVNSAIETGWTAEGTFNDIQLTAEQDDAWESVVAQYWRLSGDGDEWYWEGRLKEALKLEETRQTFYQLWHQYRDEESKQYSPEEWQSYKDDHFARFECFADWLMKQFGFPVTVNED